MSAASPGIGENQVIQECLTMTVLTWAESHPAATGFKPVARHLFPGQS
jgi:hypothetical protein